MRFTCTDLVSICTAQNAMQSDIIFITVCFAASLFLGNIAARLIIPTR